MTDRGSGEPSDGLPGKETGGTGHSAEGASGACSDAAPAAAIRRGGDAGSDLAATGAGPGTLPLVAAGAVLVAVGGTLVVARRRKRA
ncbi:LPXTG cell wall anchor domain-containing protein [Streptomyces sp. NPDC048211]|uniref:LPXTG cell wall anchor domain-containing protein n=1 Tax=Streptomyces sp. NPDC048211 TaxID=3365516 RepID=UPI003715761F